VGRLGGHILHFTVESHAQLAAKTVRYSELFAGKLRRQGRSPGWAKIWLNPPYRFLRDYLLRGGVLDGRVGLLIAWESARYTYFKYRLARPEPAGGRTTWGLPVAAGVAMALALLLAMGPGGGLWRETSSADHGDHFAEHVTHTDDGFDNRATLVARRLAIDDDVVL
jgi:hypothetical protein